MRLLVVLAALVAAASGCASRRPPVLGPLEALPASRNPVVLIPGISGSRLRDTGSGELVWGRGRHVFVPRDGGRRVALPPSATGGGGLEPAGPILELRLLGLLRYEFYAGVERLMVANGYRTGDLDAPDPEATFFIFDHDWRLDGPAIARQLAAELERLRVARGEPVLHVDLICQSNAGRIARYLLRYGGQPLESAEAAGESGPPAGLRVDRLILVGTAHGGAMATLDDLLRGRRYVPLAGRRFLPEVLFTFRSLYESLPFHESCPVVDLDGTCVDTDLADASDWERLGWSIHAPEVARRADRRPELFGDRRTRRAFLARALDRGLRLQRLLARPGPEPPTRYYSIQNLGLPTPRRAVLLPAPADQDSRRTVVGDRAPAVRRRPWLRTRVMAPGDGHATLQSLEELAPQERAALARPVAWVPAPHRDLIRHPASWRWILDYLLDGAARRIE